jgi:hypothetical protein
MRLRYSQQSPIVKSGFAFQVDYETTQSNVFGFCNTVKAYDLLYEACHRGDFHIPCGHRSLAAMFGFNNIGDVYNDVFVTEKPSSYNYSAELDTAFYGNMSIGLQLLYSTLSGRSFSPPSMQNEHNTRHATFSGELIMGQSDLPYLSEAYAFAGESPSIRRLASQVWHKVVPSSTDPLVVSLVPVNVGTYNRDLLQLLSFLQGGSFSTIQFYGSIPVVRQIKSLSYTVDDSELNIRYSSAADHPTLGYYYAWDTHIRVVLNDPVPYRSAVVGNLFATDMIGATVTFSFTNGSTIGDSRDLGPLHDTYTGAYVFPILLSDPTTTVIAEPDDFLFRCNSLRRTPLEFFRDCVDREFHDISPSSVFSSVAAFKKAEGSLGVNILQDLQKLPNIASTLPQIGKAVDILGRLLRRDLRFSTLKEILDLATSTQLQGAFEWRPYLVLLTEYIPKLVATMSSLGIPAKRLSAYGSFSFTGYNILGREEVHLLTRTKIVMDGSFSGLLSAITGLDALGIIPKPSNLWSLLPFTFVVDWFSGVNRALQLIEYSSLLCTIPAYYVHTYLLSSPLSPTELDSIGWIPGRNSRMISQENP